jgi:hypothetical protein
MRIGLIAIVLVMACSGTALSDTRYDVYIWQPHDGGPSTYAFAGGQRAAALEVRACGDVRLLPDASAVAARLSALRTAPDTDVVTVIARGSRTYLGPCGESGEEDDTDAEDDENAADTGDNLVVIEDASARQTRAMIRSLDAAPPEVRDELIAALGLQ